MRIGLSMMRLLSVALAVTVMVAVAWMPAQAAAPGDPVRERFAGDFTRVLDAYAQLGRIATEQARRGLAPLGSAWEARMKAADHLLVPFERVFFPMMNRPWSREAAVFANLQSARMWLWSIHDGLDEGARGVASIDVSGGKVRAELIANFQAYQDKARSLLNGGEFKGSYFEDTLSPVLADYCTYPEDGGRHRPSFDDPRLFDDVKAQPAKLESNI